jgi:uncharacterized protein with PIN domain
MAVDQAPIFLVERTLGRLARWLRMLGWDARLAERVPPAGREGLVVLTRRHALADRPGILFVSSDMLEDQLAQVLGELSLEPEPEKLFSRCLDCNRLVVVITRDEAIPLVPEHILHTSPRFTRCPQCGKVFWPGSHGARAGAKLEKILAGLVGQVGP